MIVGDSKCITIHEDEMADHENKYNGWSESYAQAAVILALKKENDERAEEITFGRFARTHLDVARNWSEVCYLEAEAVGYFFVMRDMVDRINVVYNRWD